jgi:hypothetical protein
MHGWPQTSQMFTVHPTCISILPACLYACLTTNQSNVHCKLYLHFYHFFHVYMHAWQQTCQMFTVHPTCMSILSACLSSLPVFMHAWRQTCQMFTVHPTCMPILSSCLYARLTTSLSNVHCPLSTLTACLSSLPVYMHMHAWQQSCQMFIVNPSCIYILSACLYACMTTNLSNVYCPPYLHV